jgi:predicted transcriptional regulator
MASPASPAALTLKQADIDLLVAICKQLGKVDTKQLAEDLGVNASAAGMRWKRFKDKAFSAEAEAGTS